jgi:branched-chain amino acid transport system ATP-binding protein
MLETPLAVEELRVAYGKAEILRGVSFEIRPSEIVCLLGSNGSGKSTALNAVSGFVRPLAGAVRFEGKDLAGTTPDVVFRAGIVQVSQRRDLFPEMTVEENLRLGGARRLPRGEIGRKLEEVYGFFPRLREQRANRANHLSGGEQQMIAIGRALMSQPKVMLLDEPSGGLAPIYVNEVGAILKRLKAGGATMLMVEQNVKLALAVADRFYVLRNGEISEAGNVAGRDAFTEEMVRRIYL